MQRRTLATAGGRGVTAPEKGLPGVRVKLGAGYRRLVHLGALSVWASGVLWLVYHYFMVRRTEFGLEHAPLEAWWLKLHGAAAFVVLWTWGLLWAVHIKRAWLAARHRMSGAGLFLAYALLVLSGYLLYYAGNEHFRAALSLLHWTVGLGLPLLLAAHIWHARIGALVQRPAQRRSANGEDNRRAGGVSCSPPG